MRHPWLLIGLFLLSNACSNATFKATKGEASRDNSAPPVQDGDATRTPPAGNPANPGTPPATRPPGVENPNTDNSVKDPCESMTLMSRSSLYQLHDEKCHQPYPGDGPGEEEEEEEDDDDKPGQNNPGQNS